MKYLITGATGFIGKHLMERLKGEDVISIDHYWNRHPIVTAEYYNRIKKFSPDIIIHCAGEINDERAMIESNIHFTQWLLTVTKDIDYKCFIHIGSSSEYGYKMHPMKETDILQPRNLYEATKGAASLLCYAHAIQHNKPITIVRPFTVYGKYEPANRLIPTIFRNISEGKQTKLAAYSYHDYIHVDDFLNRLFWIIDLTIKNKVKQPRIFNVGTGQSHSNIYIYQTISLIMNSTIEPIIDETMAKPYDSTTWQCSSIHSLFHIKYDIQAGLRDIYESNWKKK